MLYEFAGFVFDLKFHYDFSLKMCEQYVYTGDKLPDYTIDIPAEVSERIAKNSAVDFCVGNFEFLEVYREICKILCDKGYMFMHCSSIAYKGNGILFTAPSGTGKSTHSALWKRHFGEDVVIVNDDKPLLHITPDVIEVCGTPWDGKHKRSANISAPIKSIVILSQGSENKIEKATKQEAFYTILNQTIRAMDKNLMTLVLDMVERLLDRVPVYKLSCTISDEAVMTVFETIKEYFDED